MALATLGAVVLECPDPMALAGFYAGLLGGEITAMEDAGDNWVDLVGDFGTPLAFQGAPDFVPPRWPGTDGSQQFHLDLKVPDLDAAEREVLALGATVLDAADRERSFRVYADPVGHPFCLCAC
ncbi:VOC family protein [Streptomyces sp. NBC_00876]|uniref:VOC family protein n=1 Tax=Streptomyces sp. NBC_00876 TaxID=2975853 RepID=UPI00386626C2|nr:VOC family protein [Streptomyces sp. NBC_00876]